MVPLQNDHFANILRAPLFVDLKLKWVSPAIFWRYEQRTRAVASAPESTTWRRYWLVADMSEERGPFLTSKCEIENGVSKGF